MKDGDFPEDKIKKANKQMRSVWCIPTPSAIEKTCGKHPTQKPLALLKRIVLASTNPGDIVLDPFNGGGTTGVAVKIIGDRQFIGIDIESEYLELTIRRYEELTDE
jgi:site-specific DNA-methyltransferase (adenine-specific)